MLDEVLDLGQPIEVPVGDRLIDGAAEVLGGLEFGGVGRQVDEPHAMGQAQSWFGVPARSVERQDDRALRACAGLAGEQG
ncbi:hypothetical protein MKK58_00600, partial [Methylobacterium sp. J-078]|uniref:hypothetical protein n=1 Tax=Methylobacterium sp. J-078 TaxID=2836657 RepID=UPI001FBAE5A5